MLHGDKTFLSHGHATNVAPNTQMKKLFCYTSQKEAIAELSKIRYPHGEKMIHRSTFYRWCKALGITEDRAWLHPDENQKLVTLATGLAKGLSIETVQYITEIKNHAEQQSSENWVREPEPDNGATTFWDSFWAS